ncbi:MAG: LEA type 2 family protein [Gemmatimonadetes bacterium]|nr:LEA type 2 family protein [Gemmatimonadota bacterium]
MGRATAVSLAGLTLATLACSLAQRLRFEAPSAQLTGVTITGLGFSGGSLELKLDVLNPNSYTLRSTRLQVAIDLENTPFGTAAIDRALELPPAAHSEVRVPLTFTWSGVGAGARAMLSKGSLKYGLTGRLLVGSPLGERSVDLRTSGVVAVADLAR